MNKKIALGFMSLPAVAGSLLAPMAAAPASAQEAITAPAQPDSCLQSPRIQANQFSCRRAGSNPTTAASNFQGVPVASAPETTEPERIAAAPAAPESEHPSLDFSYAESDAAVALFGCDCPACLNSLRKLRAMIPVTDDNRDPCWVVTQEEYTANMGKVLVALRVAEIRQESFNLNWAN